MVIRVFKVTIFISFVGVARSALTKKLELTHIWRVESGFRVKLYFEDSQQKPVI